MRTLLVQVWSDIACPWCYIGKRRLEAAVARMPADAVEVVWRSFELNPAAPRAQVLDRSYAERLADKYGTSLDQANAMIDRMTSVAAAEGLEYRFDRVRPTNTFDAHRVLHLARAHGIQGAVEERLLRAYMTEGECLGDPATLVRLAADAGLDRDETGRVLAGDAYAAEVRADEVEARRLGIDGVPFFVVGGVHGVSGAQPAEALHEVLVRARTEAAQREPVEPGGAACGPGGCR